MHAPPKAAEADADRWPWWSWWSDSREAEDVATSTSSWSVPSVDVFRAKWENFTQQGLRNSTQDRHPDDPRPVPLRSQYGSSRGMRMLVGVFSTLAREDRAYRDVIRSTWMMQPHVCRAEELGNPPAHCAVFATFVVGRPSDAAAAGTGESTVSAAETANQTPDEQDLTLLDTAESMNCGKSWAWFAYAAQRYPQATHIAKMDLDAFVDVANLMSVVREYSGDCPYSYGGRPWYCPEAEVCPPWKCGQPLTADFRGAYQGDVHSMRRTRLTCWAYMQGGFYFMSRALASAVSQAGGWWDQQSQHCYPEDAAAGKAVMQWAWADTTSCANVINLHGEHVVWHPEFSRSWSSEFAQDFPK